MPRSISIRRISPNGPSVPGELLTTCPILHADGLCVDITFPPDFALPDEPISVVLYMDDEKYLGYQVLGPDGFVAEPDADNPVSPYFTIEIDRGAS